MLKFNTKDFHEHCQSIAVFTHIDQKKVCFYKRTQMDFINKMYSYIINPQ